MRIKEVTIKSGDVALFPGDIHFDAHDPDALDLMVDVAISRRVSLVGLIGDTFESVGISRHGRPARKFVNLTGTIAAEREAARPWLQTLKSVVTAFRGRRPGGLHVLQGNHEAWWDLVQDEYPGLLGHTWHEPYGDLFDGWHVYGEGTSLKLGPLLVTHGHRLRGSLARSSAASVLANYPGQNTLYGHTHRVDSCITPSYKYGAPVRHGAWTIGHMKSMEREFEDRAIASHAERHLQGFALVNFYEVEGEMRFGVDQVTVDRMPSGKPYCIVGGQFYSA